MIEIDGACGEGGGQILRLSVALSAMSKKPVRIFNIRVKRSKPGLKRQHMVSIESVAKICNAQVKGLKLNSTQIQFYPGDIQGGTYRFNIGTAGSITLVLQACILPSLFAENNTHLEFEGGTDVKWSPPWDYFLNVVLPLLTKMGVKIETHLEKRGYYPIGKGKVAVNIYPIKKFKEITFNDEIKNIKGLVNIANLPITIAERIKKSAENELKTFDIKTKINTEVTFASCPGVGIVLWTEGKILGADCLGERGTSAELVGKTAAEKLSKEIKAGVDLDYNAVDQILPYLSLTNGCIQFKSRSISTHAETEMFLIKKFLDKAFYISKNDVCNVKIKR